MGAFPFTRGSFGKHQKFSTQMGFCIPAQCSADVIEKALEGPIVLKYAEAAGWENAKVSWTYPSADETKPTTANYMCVLVVVMFMGLVGLGTIVEVLPCCDKPEY